MRYKKNLTLKLEISISHFTGVRKIITLSLVILILSLINITLCLPNSSSNSVSALSYESSVGIGFTFNPTLSVSLSSSDLVISNLTPGSSANSNSINVNVATNASYGYTLSVNANSDDLVHSNNANTFSSIATDADLASLDDSEDNNIWGYTTSLDSGSTWNNYNGLSSSISTTLLDTNTNNPNTDIDTIDFKIGAKASFTQASGIYTNTITFTAVTKPTPMTLAEAYASEGKTMINGFYTMQDMTSTICSKVEAIGSQLQVLDIRDYKVYWVAKLADHNCWMTQNLELDLIAGSTILNSTNTDIDPNSYDITNGAYSPESGYSKDESTNVVTWSPQRDTITVGNLSSSTWANNYNNPYSYNPGNIYYYYDSPNSTNYAFNSLEACQTAGYTSCDHYKAGNYYNWSAAVASNNTNTLTEQKDNADNSICPKNWRLLQNDPINDFNNILTAYDITASKALDLQLAPMWLVLSGDIDNGRIARQNQRACYWSSTIYSNSGAYRPYFQNRSFSSNSYGWRGYGFPIRCLAR